MAPSLPAFMVQRGEPVLVVPAAPTPRKKKPLSDIDDTVGMRFYSCSSGKGSSGRRWPGPSSPYHPLAGRLREEAGRKLVVDCGAQGVMFAHHSLALASSSSSWRAPLPVLVTRLRCGGFIFGHRVCHCMVDAPGCMQFQKAIGELARGADAPSVAPAWDREMFMAPAAIGTYPTSATPTTAGELCDGNLGYVLELVKKAKSAMTYDYLLSVEDLMVITGRPMFALSRAYIVSDVSHAGFKAVDFGWGEAVYGGPAKGGEGPVPGMANYFLRAKNGNGEEGTVVANPIHRLDHPGCRSKLAASTVSVMDSWLFSLLSRLTLVSLNRCSVYQDGSKEFHYHELR
ncbi:hypothetical protein ACQ4PT_057250 [Festuca glaucescens]